MRQRSLSRQNRWQRVLWSHFFCLFLGCWLSCWGRTASAADTVEPFAVGATDVEFYLSYEGIGRAQSDHLLVGDMFLGYGLLQNFSSYLGVALQGNGFLANGAAQLYSGLIWNTVNTRHVDLDLMFGLRYFQGEFVLRPLFELNIDGDPEMASWGLYLRGGAKLTGANASQDASNPVWSFAYGLDATVGIYYTFFPGQQLLLEYDMAFSPQASPPEKAIDIGGVALGYNISLHKRIELITEVFFDIPQQDEAFAVRLLVGFIATLPAAK